MGKIPQAVGDIDPEWLRGAVSPANAATFQALTSVTAARLAEGVGIATDLYRLSLHYAPGAPAGPASLVVKRPASNPVARKIAGVSGLYRREVAFYREVAATVAMRIPKPYVAEIDPATQDFVIVMEDLAPAVDGDQVAGLSLARVTQALDQIAILHAAWWNRPQLADLETTIHPFGQGPWAGTGARLAEAWLAFAPFVAARASPVMVRIGERMPALIEPLMADLAQAPRTLCHGDFRADNMMFTPGDEAGGLFTVDWQAPVQARGSIDVGYLVSMSITTELRRAHEDELLRRYHDGLLAGGVTGYGYDAFVQDYRRSVLAGYFHVILGGAASDLTHGRLEALFERALLRLEATVVDHRLEDLVA